MAEFSRLAGSQSPTGDADEAYEVSSRDSKDCYDFDYPEGSAGVAVAIDGEVVALDCFDRPATMRRLFTRLIRSYVLEAIGKEREARRNSLAGLSHSRNSLHRKISAEIEAVKSFLEEVGSREAQSAPGLFMGEDLRVQTKDWCAAALAHEGRILHAELFPDDVV